MSDVVLVRCIGCGAPLGNQVPNAGALAHVMECDRHPLAQALADAKKLAAEGRKAGRAEAAAILMAQEAESFPSAYGDDALVESYPIGDTGDYGAAWVPHKVLDLFDAADSEMTSILERLEGGYWEAVGRKDDADWARDRALKDRDAAESRALAAEARADDLAGRLATETAERERVRALGVAASSALETMRARVGALAAEWAKEAAATADSTAIVLILHAHAKALRAALGSPSTPAVDWEAVARSVFSALAGPLNQGRFDDFVGKHTSAAPDATPEDAP